MNSKPGRELGDDVRRLHHHDFSPQNEFVLSEEGGQNGLKAALARSSNPEDWNRGAVSINEIARHAVDRTANDRMTLVTQNPNRVAVGNRDRFPRINRYLGSLSGLTPCQQSHDARENHPLENLFIGHAWRFGPTQQDPVQSDM
jgi:hypothetical protein